MKKYVAALLLVLVCSANMAYSDSKPTDIYNVPDAKIQNHAKTIKATPIKVKTLCDTAREDQQRQAENVPAVANNIVECFQSGEQESVCQSKFYSFGNYYNYLKEASARVKQYCN